MVGAMTIDRDKALGPGWVKVEDFIEWCEQDPDCLRAKAEREQRQAELARAERPLVEDLRAAGLDVSSVGDLVNTTTPYPDAIPILLEHLQRDYPGPIRDCIARALAVREAQYAWPVLVREYVALADGPGVKQGLAVALSNTLTEERLDEFLDLVHDLRHGESRGLLLLGLQRLSRSTKSRAREALEALSTDPVLGPEVQRILKRRRRAGG
jgi:hypothetical protein